MPVCQPASVWPLLGRAEAFERNPVPSSLSLLIPDFLPGSTLPSSLGSSSVVGFLAEVPALLGPLSAGEGMLSNSFSCPLTLAVPEGPVWEKQLVHYLWSASNQPC